MDGAQTNIVFNAVDEGITGATFTWSFTGFQTSPVNSGTNTQTITPAQFGTSKSATVKCTVTGTEGSVFDVLTVVRLEKNTADGDADNTTGKLSTGVVLNSGGITLGALSKINSDGKDTWNSAVPGFYLGYTGVAGVYGLDIVGMGRFRVRSAATGARLEITDNVIKVYDANGTLRVKMGDLSA